MEFGFDEVFERSAVNRNQAEDECNGDFKSRLEVVL